jgi:hypothetical protein
MKSPSFVVAISLCLGCRATSGRDVRPEASAHPTTSSPSGASEALDKLDRRRPVPLLPMMAQHQKQNMREHLEAVQQVVAAVAAGDFDRVAVSAKRMGYSETMGRMCEHMGAGAPGFSEQALAFHHAADEIVGAAAKQDGPAVLAALSKTLGACTTCHSTYKQRLVESLPE